MDQNSSATPSPSEENLPSSTPQPSRRTFLQKLLAGVMIAGPAISSLFNSSPALAAHSGHCSPNVTYVEYIENDCVGGRMIGYYDVRCGVCGGYCHSFTEDQGPCCGGLTPC